MSALLELHGVRKEFLSDARPLAVLDGVDLSLSPGESLAVMGPSGSGKSTLLGVMAGLERPTSGRVLFKGRPLEGLPEDALAAWRRRSVGFIFQSFRLVPSLSALENVMLPLEILGQDPRRAALRARSALEELGLLPRAGHRPHELSGGEQQRVAIGRALIHGPELLLADEPTGSLDRKTGLQVLDALLCAQRSKGAALVLVTHDPAVAAKLDRTLALG